MDWGKALRVGVGVVTGGASEVVIAAAEAEKRKREQQQASQQSAAASPETPLKVESSPVSVNLNSCCRYQLQAPFLLDSQDGRVWIYDDKKKKFLAVTKEQSVIEKSWEALVAAKFTADFVEAVNDTSISSSHAENTRVTSLIESHIKVLDEHVKKLSK